MATDTNNNDIVEVWRDWIVERMLGEVLAGRDPGSVDDVKMAAEQAREYFEQKLIELTGRKNAQGS